MLRIHLAPQQRNRKMSEYKVMVDPDTALIHFAYEHPTNGRTLTPQGAAALASLIVKILSDLATPPEDKPRIQVPKPRLPK